MFNSLNNDIISKSQICEEIAKSSVSSDLFAKTVSCSGVEHKFHIDIPEILSYEKQLEERKIDIEKFTNLVMSIDDSSCNERINSLYMSESFAGSDFEAQILSELSRNENLLDDLGLN